MADLRESGQLISTHALREEGDGSTFSCLLTTHQFLPTPSARRATGTAACSGPHSLRFLPTPSARRATYRRKVLVNGVDISTHALREEGDRSTLESQKPAE